MATARVNILNKMYIIVYTADFRTTSCKDLRNVYKYHEHGVNNKCFSFSTFPFFSANDNIQETMSFPYR